MMISGVAPPHAKHIEVLGLIIADSSSVETACMSSTWCRDDASSSCNNL